MGVREALRHEWRTIVCMIAGIGAWAAAWIMLP